MTIFAPLFTLALAVAQPASQPQPDQASTTIDQPSGKIIFYRKGSVVGAAVACPIRYQGSEVIELGRGKAFDWQVAPGRYILENGTSSVEVTVAAGETRYVRCQIKTGFLSGRADLQIVDGTEYAKAKANFEPAGD